MREVHGPRNAVVIGCALTRIDTLDQAQQLYFSLVADAEPQFDTVKICCILVAAGMCVG
jgi:hypothetical protein